MNEEMISTSDIRGTAEADLTVETAWNVGKATADWLPTAGSVAVVYAPAQKTLASAVVEGLRLQGRHVIDGGPGDGQAATTHITTSGLSGGVLVGFDQAESVATIEIYQDKGMLVTADTGLDEIRELVEAGNFVPAAIKGELTAIA